MGFQTGGRPDTMADINVTPLVDVMLVLLIIFMITAPLLNNAGIDIDLPHADAPPLQADNEEQILLSVDVDRNVYVNDIQTPFTIDELPTRLQALAATHPDWPVFLRADGALAYRDVITILDVARHAGMPKVGLVLESGSVEGPTP